MADVQGTSQHAGLDQPPGTFLLIRGKSPFKFQPEPILTSADGEIPVRSQREVMLDPVPSSDPNEPLVSHCDTHGDLPDGK